MALPQYRAVTATDADLLADIRVAAMRPSLEQLGRFNLQRARARLLDEFVAEHTVAIYHQQQLAGFYVLEPAASGKHLRHFYLLPEQSGQGLGSAVITDLNSAADLGLYVITLGALLGSAANRFYQRHGYVETHRDEWDIYYARVPAPASALGVGYAR